MTFAFSDPARETESMSDQEVAEEIMVCLRDIYGQQIPGPVEFLRTKWNSNPNAYGSYTYFGLGSKSSHIDDLASSVDDKVFFSGEHTAKQFRATTQGAYLTGCDQAEKIVSLLKVLN